MKIVIIDKEEGQKVGGVVIYSERLYSHLIKNGHDVSILRYAKKKPKQKHVHRIPYYLAEPRSYIFVPSEKSIVVIRKHLTKIQPDIVYTSIGMSPLDFFLPSLCHDLKIPIAGVWHADFNSSAGSYQLLAKSVFLAYLPFCRQLDLLHVFSAKFAQFYVQRGIAKKRILILPNGVEPEFYAPGTSSFTKSARITTGILFLGRLTLQKNPEALIQSFLSVKNFPDVKLVLVGHGEQERDLREKYHSNRIIFMGVEKNEERKRDIMRSCQIFVLPSRFEGMSLALLEAMSCGLACIASDAGANGELLKDAGIVIPATRVKQELPLALRILLENPDFSRKLGEKARKKILNNYAQEKIFSTLQDALKETVKDYRRRGSPPSKSLDLEKTVREKLQSIFLKTKQLSSMFNDTIISP